MLHWKRYCASFVWHNPTSYRTSHATRHTPHLTRLTPQIENAQLADLSCEFNTTTSLRRLVTDERFSHELQVRIALCSYIGCLISGVWGSVYFQLSVGDFFWGVDGMLHFSGSFSSSYSTAANAVAAAAHTSIRLLPKNSSAKRRLFCFARLIAIFVSSERHASCGT